MKWGSNNFIQLFKFIWKPQLQRTSLGWERARKSTCSFFKWPQQLLLGLALGLAKTESQEFLLSLPCGCRGLRSWDILHCFSRYSNRKLNWKRNSWDSNQYPYGMWVSQVAVLPWMPQYQLLDLCSLVKCAMQQFPSLLFRCNCSYVLHILDIINCSFIVI